MVAELAVERISSPRSPAAHCKKRYLFSADVNDQKRDSEKTKDRVFPISQSCQINKTSTARRIVGITRGLLIDKTYVESTRRRLAVAGALGGARAGLSSRRRQRRRCFRRRPVQSAPSGRHRRGGCRA